MLKHYHMPPAGMTYNTLVRGQNRRAYAHINNSHKKYYQSIIPEEITHENFGAIRKINGGLGSRNASEEIKGSLRSDS